jgi:hypothetical protein
MKDMRYEVVTKVTAMITAAWGVTPCSMVGIYQHFPITLNVEVGRFSETFAYIYMTPPRLIPEYIHFHRPLRQLTSHTATVYTVATSAHSDLLQ